MPFPQEYKDKPRKHSPRAVIRAMLTAYVEAAVEAHADAMRAAGPEVDNLVLEQRAKKAEEDVGALLEEMGNYIGLAEHAKSRWGTSEEEFAETFEEWGLVDDCAVSRDFYARLFGTYPIDGPPMHHAAREVISA